jgi:methyltransferase (TIGR00027 family)
MRWTQMENKTKSGELTISRESPSKMAEGMAMHRYLESLKSKEERICYDPYAVHFINPQIIEYGKKHPEKANSKLEQMEKMFPGLSSSIIARVRYFDDYVTKYIEEGIEQLIILGAGYDTRAYRIIDLKDVKVFEVDHPNTQTFKIKKIRDIFGTTPSNVTYVPLDFEYEELGQKLFENGYNYSKKTLLIMEGLIMYIPEEAVQKILTFFTKNSGTNSSIIFDYYPESVVDGSCKDEIGINIRNFVIQQGEPLQFGIEEEKIHEFLSNYGFKHINNVRGDEYKQAYFHGKNENREICNLLSFAYAMVR